MSYAAKILADSISPAGHRLTSFEGCFPRIVLAEVNTHRKLSRNSASSRAIPVEKRIAAVEQDPFVPAEFGKNKKGMQHDEVLGANEHAVALSAWTNAKDDAIKHARWLANVGVHKQLANRLLEPFSWHTAVLTATDWDNFFHLRVNPAAQGEFRRVAEMMQGLYDKSTPRLVGHGEWHLPYVEIIELGTTDGGARDVGEAFWLRQNGYHPQKISAARCARVSYLTQDGKRDPKEDQALYDRLVEPGHLSPLEHPARPMTDEELHMFARSRHRWNGERFVIESGEMDHYLGNFNGWVQLRKMIPGEDDILGHRAAS